MTARTLALASALLVTAAVAGCAKKEAAPADKPTPQPAAAPAVAATPRQLDIVVTEKGFEPDQLTVKKGEAVQLAFTRKTDKTCAKQVVLQLGDGKKIEKPLPLDETVLIGATFAQGGQLRYACAMDMFAGVITVE